jgi:anti-sigma factor RsiW
VTCEELSEMLTDFLEGELNEQQTDMAVAHLASCPHCETVLSLTRTLIESSKELGRVTLEPDHRAELLTSILKARKQ